MHLTRRHVIVWLPTAMAVARCVHVDPKEPFKILTDAQAAALDAYADQVLPPDGHTLGAARYVDRLLSDTEPLISSLGTSVPLDRLAKVSWDKHVAALKEQLLPLLNTDQTVTALMPEDRELI